MLRKMGALRLRVRDSAAAFAAVFRNANLRRLQIAAGGAAIGGWAYTVAVSVFAYHADGATGVGVVWLIRMIPAAFATPFAALLADRFPRERVMVVTDLLDATLMGAAAASAYAGQPPEIVYGLAAGMTLVGTAFNPAEAALTPTLARTPSELTAANVVSSTIESTGFFVGPALAGVLLAVTSIPTVFVIAAALLLWSAFFVARIRPAYQAPPEEAATAPTVLAEIGAGFKAVGNDRRLRILVGLISTESIVTGALEVLVVVTAIELLEIGNSGVGYLESAIGVGALVAALLGGALLVGVQRLSVPFLVGSILWGAPFIPIALFVEPAVAFVMFGVVGLGATLADVTAHTLMQRAAPNEILGRVYGVAQSLWLVTLGAGAVITPLVINWLGARAALIATGMFIPALLVLLGPRLVRVDAAATAPAVERLDLLRSTDIFAPLPGIALEQLASQLIPLEEEPATEIIRQGDVGDRFYIIAAGEVDVAVDGTPISVLGPGDYFGEIALLRDVPRTATCTAKMPVRLFALEREDFLSAVTGHAASARTAEGVVASRLGGLSSATGVVSTRPARI